MVNLLKGIIIVIGALLAVVLGASILIAIGAVVTAGAIAIQIIIGVALLFAVVREAFSAND